MDSTPSKSSAARTSSAPIFTTSKAGPMQKAFQTTNTFKTMLCAAERLKRPFIMTKGDFPSM